jgi:DNA mismatch repair protein MutS
VGLAWLNLASGQFTLSEVGTSEAASHLERLDFAELLIAENGVMPPLRNGIAPPTRTLPPWRFDADGAAKTLCKQLGTLDLAAFGVGDRPLAIGAAGALLDYAASTQAAALAHVTSLNVRDDSDYLQLDAATGRNLEITATLRGDPAPTLLSLLDTCVTSAGSRMLRRWLTSPMRSQDAAASRHAAIAAWHQQPGARRKFARDLTHAADVERISGRVALLSARPRDLAGLRDTLRRLPHLRESIATVIAPGTSPLLAALEADLAVDAQWADLLARAIAAEPSHQVRDGGVIATGFDRELDELRSIDDRCGEFLLALETRERERTGIANLKVEFNRVHGFYIEVGNASAAKVPDDYRRRQTLKNAERYITPELKAFEDKALSAQERALQREKVLYEKLLADLAPAIPALQRMASALAQLDVLSTLAERAETLDLARPLFVAAPGIAIRGGRHPVVERQVDTFIANDLTLRPDRRLLVITGPNMGGKSTFMRQAAVIALLAYCGSFVPAQAAEIGPLNAIHTRIGAADDLAGGRSTFMVEMTEAAAILHRATPQSLVLIDEIGRGTSTYDGLALAWAIAHQLAEKNRCLTLFATHYFELTGLPAELDGCANIHFDAVVHADEIVFMHAVAEGPANQSYGVQVAKLAGVPGETVRKARSYLSRLDKFNASGQAQADLFAASGTAVNDPDNATLSTAREPLIERLAAIDPDALSPRDALAALYELKRLLDC